MELDDINLNIGPGPNWRKPSAAWQTVDIDPGLADIMVDLRLFSHLPLKSGTVNCIYASHVLEHVSVYVADSLLKECFRVLKRGGFMRIIIPDVVKSMEEYLKGNQDYLLFSRRRSRAKELRGEDYTLFECLKEDFISRSGQPRLLGKYALAHQNAFDYDTLVKNLLTAGFEMEGIWRSGFRQSRCVDFAFEGEFESEANEDYRSMYVECQK